MELRPFVWTETSEATQSTALPARGRAVAAGAGGGVLSGARDSVSPSAMQRDLDLEATDWTEELVWCSQADAEVAEAAAEGCCPSLRLRTRCLLVCAGVSNRADDMRCSQAHSEVLGA